MWFYSLMLSFLLVACHSEPTPWTYICGHFKIRVSNIFLWKQLSRLFSAEICDLVFGVTQPVWRVPHSADPGLWPELSRVPLLCLCEGITGFLWALLGSTFAPSHCAGTIEIDLENLESPQWELRARRFVQQWQPAALETVAESWGAWGQRGYTHPEKSL